MAASGTWHRLSPNDRDLEQAGDGDEDDLKAHLKQKLSEPAYNEAVQLLDRYKTYMKEHDDRLAVQSLWAALDELQQCGLDPSSPPSTEPGQPLPHWSSPAEEQQHVQYKVGLLKKQPPPTPR